MYRTLTCTLVREGNKRFFPHTEKWTSTSGERVLSIVDSIKKLKPSTLRSLTFCWLVQRYMVCFSLTDKPKLVIFHPHPQCDCMSSRGNKYILMDFLIPGIALCYVQLMSTSICRSHHSWIQTCYELNVGPRHNIRKNPTRQLPKQRYNKLKAAGLHFLSFLW